MFLTAAPERYRFLHEGAGIDVRTCDTSSETAVTAAVDDIAASMAIKLLTTSSDLYLYVSALQARRLGLAGPDPDVIALCQDKARQTAALHAARIGVPSSFTVRAECDIYNAIARIGLPAVAKPISGTGSVGVALVETEPDAIRVLRNLIASKTDVRGCPRQSGALLMSYIVGDEFSVEILDGRLIGVTRKHLGSLPHFVEIGHDAPAAMPTELSAKIIYEALSAVSVLGHLEGPAHVELRVHQGGVTIIEVNPRLAGGSIPSLFRHATGFDSVLAVLRSLLGMPPLTPGASAHGSIRFIVPNHEGRFDISQSREQIVRRFGLAEYSLYRNLPTEFRRHNDFRDRIGHIIAIDDDPAVAAWRAEAAVAFIHQA
ncbi:ATP-grasp domain-containing protein [Bradyrhizobium canariense]|uniref:ATP-grasp domain-containing protein n=1 Tax=Bradyrhizobium canariense TaxID=255045 RepID=UPI000A18BA2D|nr:ATP-grasp domain-containing protein [Bradyrhizobium canariense]